MSLYEIEEHIGAPIEESDLPADSVVEACKAEAEKWIKEKFQSSVMASTAAPKETKKKNQQTKPATHQDKHRPHPPREGGRTAGDTHDRYPKGPRQEIPRETRPEAPKDHVEASNRKPDVQPIQNKTTKTDNPLLQRMMKKLLGK
jgi:hypothetical protein